MVADSGLSLKTITKKSFGNWFFKETNGRDDNAFDFYEEPEYLIGHPELRKQFRPGSELKKRLMTCKPKGNLIGIHLRRGDYVNRRFIPPNEWYKNWLDKIWNVHSVLFIASDDVNAWRDFTRFNPINGFRHVLPEAPAYADFWMLTQCRKLAISNSTFSFAAAMMNVSPLSSVRFLRPTLEKLIEFNPWDSPVLLKLDNNIDNED